MKAFNVYYDEITLEELKKVSDELGLDTSSLVRMISKKYLKYYHAKREQEEKELWQKGN